MPVRQSDPGAATRHASRRTVTPEGWSAPATTVPDRAAGRPTISAPTRSFAKLKSLRGPDADAEGRGLIPSDLAISIRLGRATSPVSRLRREIRSKGGRGNGSRGEIATSNQPRHSVMRRRSRRHGNRREPEPGANIHHFLIIDDDHPACSAGSQIVAGRQPEGGDPRGDDDRRRGGDDLNRAAARVRSGAARPVAAGHLPGFEAAAPAHALSAPADPVLGPRRSAHRAQAMSHGISGFVSRRRRRARSPARGHAGAGRRGLCARRFEKAKRASAFGTAS